MEIKYLKVTGIFKGLFTPRESLREQTKARQSRKSCGLISTWILYLCETRSRSHSRSVWVDLKSYTFGRALTVLSFSLVLIVLSLNEVRLPCQFRISTNVKSHAIHNVSVKLEITLEMASWNDAGNDTGNYTSTESLATFLASWFL